MNIKLTISKKSFIFFWAQHVFIISNNFESFSLYLLSSSSKPTDSKLIFKFKSFIFVLISIFISHSYCSLFRDNIFSIKSNNLFLTLVSFSDSIIFIMKLKGLHFPNIILIILILLFIKLPILFVKKSIKSSFLNEGLFKYF